MNGVSKQIWDTVKGYHEGPISNVLRCTIKLRGGEFGWLEVYTGSKDNCTLRKTKLGKDVSVDVYQELKPIIGIQRVTELSICIEPDEVPEVKAKFYLT